MEVMDVHAPRDEDDVELQSEIPVDFVQLPFESSFDNSFWRLPVHEHDDPLMNGLQTNLSQPGYALPDEYVDDDPTNSPTISDFHQNFMRNEEHQGPSSLMSFSSKWFQHEHSIPGPDIPLHDAEGDQYVHGPLSLASDGQDSMTILEDTHVSSLNDPYHPALVSGDARDSGPTPPPIPMTPSGGPNSLRCRHYVQGRPCGVPIEGGLPGILEHIARVHVRPRISANARSDLPSEFWVCRWNGKCNTRIRKEGFRRHVLGHLVRWKCSTCSSTYSRDDSARKHARDCGDGMIVMQPRLEVCPRRL